MAKTPAKDNTNGAATGDVLQGKAYWGLRSGGWGDETGTMTNRGAVSITPAPTAQTVQEGYHNGSGTVEGDADLVTGNIKAGVNIFGVSGKTTVVDTESGDAAAGDVLSTRKAWVAGLEVTGTMPNRGAVNITPGITAQTVQLGFHNGLGMVAGDADLVPEKIADGVTLFGVTGTYKGGGGVWWLDASQFTVYDDFSAYPAGALASNSKWTVATSGSVATATIDASVQAGGAASELRLHADKDYSAGICYAQVVSAGSFVSAKEYCTNIAVSFGPQGGNNSGNDLKFQVYISGTWYDAVSLTARYGTGPIPTLLYLAKQGDGSYDAYLGGKRIASGIAGVSSLGFRAFCEANYTQHHGSITLYIDDVRYRQ